MSRTKIDHLSAQYGALYMRESDDDTLICCERADAMELTVMPGGEPGVSIECLQMAAGQVRLVPGAGVTFKKSATFLSNVSEEGGSIFVTCLNATTYRVCGDLEAA